MKTGPPVFISHHTSVLKPVCNYYCRMAFFIELEIKTSPGDKMSLFFTLPHIHQSTVIEPRPGVEFRDCKMAGSDALMYTRIHTPQTLGLNFEI